jgi:hypothetical protein
MKLFKNYKILLLLALFFLPHFASAGMIMQAPSSLGLSSGLVGYWTMDDKNISGTTVTDKSGNGNNGTISGATKTAGKLGQALKFDGTSNKKIPKF